MKNKQRLYLKLGIQVSMSSSHSMGPTTTNCYTVLHIPSTAHFSCLLPLLLLKQWEIASRASQGGGTVIPFLLLFIFFFFFFRNRDKRKKIMNVFENDEKEKHFGEISLQR